MRILLIITLSLLAYASKAQSSLNMSLAYQWSDPTLVSSSAHDNTYNEVWGYEKDGSAAASDTD